MVLVTKQFTVNLTHGAVARLTLYVLIIHTKENNTVLFKILGLLLFFITKNPTFWGGYDPPPAHCKPSLDPGTLNLPG